jgi:hypothetical protein
MAHLFKVIFYVRHVKFIVSQLRWNSLKYHQNVERIANEHGIFIQTIFVYNMRIKIHQTIS